VELEILTKASVKMAVFWVIASCSLIEVSARCLVIDLMMEAGNTPETPVNFGQTTKRNNPEDSHLQ
jgi:L-ascorbate metabolism protein UlaG (beta-lactamase superfamily)